MKIDVTDVLLCTPKARTRWPDVLKVNPGAHDAVRQVVEKAGFFVHQGCRARYINQSILTRVWQLEMDVQPFTFPIVVTANEPRFVDNLMSTQLFRPFDRHLDPTDRTHAVGFNPLAGSSDPSLIADQLGELFQRLWHAFWGPRTGQLAHMSLLTLARRPGSTLIDLPRLFLDPTFRRDVLRGLDDPVGLEPDWRWYEGLPAREQATVIAPLLNKVRQFTARPAIRAIVGQATPAISMQRLMAQRQILLVYLPKGLIGAETAQLLGCLLLTSLWQAATERARLARNQRQPFGLYVDEVQDFAASPIPWDEMFSQGRKYGLALSVAHQNLMQIDRELRETVLANARTKAVFALSSADAKALEPLFAPALTASDLQALDAYAVAASVALSDGSTARPVTLTTPPPPNSLGSSAAVRRASRMSYARPRLEIETELRQQASPQRPPAAPVGRKRRSHP